MTKYAVGQKIYYAGDMANRPGGDHKKFCKRRMNMTRKEIELLNGAVVTREQFEAIEEHEEVERVENNGISGNISATWYTVYFTDGEETDIYFKQED